MIEKTEGDMALTRAFLRWLWSPSYGDDRRYQYHEGYLARDRWQPLRLGEPMWPNTPVDQLALQVWKAYEEGQVHLIQEKVRDGVFAYWAIKTKEQL